jgi:hypothetical protein
MSLVWRTCLVTLAFLAVVYIIVKPAMAHSWYPWNCCNDRDCRPIPFESIKVTPTGYQVPSGEIIPFSSTKIKPTPAEDVEQRFHWCSVAGSDTGHTLCLFVPQGGV